jgi:hypothetical protein
MFHGRRPGMARHKIDAFRRRVGMDEVESRRSYLVAQRENSEDRLKPTGGAEQMAWLVAGAWAVEFREQCAIWPRGRLEDMLDAAARPAPSLIGSSTVSARDLELMAHPRSAAFKALFIEAELKEHSDCFRSCHPFLERPFIHSRT